MMRHRIRGAAVLCAGMILAAACTSFAAPPPAAPGGAPVLARLKLELGTDKTVYRLGEMVGLRFRLVPRAESTLAPARMSVEDGSLALLVQRGSEDWLAYHGPGWGVKRTSGLAPVMLEPHHAVESTGTVLYNDVPETAHLSPMYAKAQLEGRIASPYAFPQAGAYRLKAVCRSRYSDETLESDPVAIKVIDPTGDDVAVWRLLQRNPRLGYLLQAGIMSGAATEADEDAALAMLREMVRVQPSGAYTVQARKRLQQFQAFVDDERRMKLRTDSTGEPR